MDKQLATSFLQHIFAQVPGHQWISCLAIDRTADQSSRSSKKVEWGRIEEIEDLVERLEPLSDTHCIWYGVATRKSRPSEGRGGAEDCALVPAMWADLDVTGPGHVSTNLPPTEEAANRVPLSDFLSVSMTVKTGGGLQPYWLLSEPIPAEEALPLLDRWRYTWQQRLGQRGWHCDAVFDLARVLRLPGTYNCKGLATDPKARPRPVTLVEEHLNTYAAKELEAVTRERPKVGVTAPTMHHEGLERGGDHFSRVHRIGEVLQMLGFHSPEADRRGTHWTRPGKEPNAGSSATVYHDAPDKVIVWSSSCTEIWPSVEVNKPYDAFGLLVAAKYNGDFSRAAEDLRSEGYGYEEEEHRSTLLDEIDAFDAQGRANQPKAPSTGWRSTRTTMADVEDETVEWLWSTLVPKGKTTIIDGDPGNGKSTLTLYMAAAVSTGSPLYLDEGRRMPRDVLLLSLEDGLGDTVKPRLQSHGADLTRVHHWRGPERPVKNTDGREILTASFPSCCSDLEQEIRAVNAGLVIIDPLAAYFDADIQTNNDASVRRAMAPLADVAQRTDAAIVVVRHLTKDTSKSALHRGGGSIGITGVARSVLLVAQDPNDRDRRVIAQTKGNLAVITNRCLVYRLTSDDIYECAHITWDGEVVMTADELLSAQGTNGSRLAHAADWLEEYLAGGPQPTKKVEADAKTAGHAWATVRRAAVDLDVKKYKQPDAGQNAPWLWRLPGDESVAA